MAYLPLVVRLFVLGYRSMEPRDTLSLSNDIDHPCRNTRYPRSFPDLGSHDCTRIDPPPGASPFIQLFRSIDWSATSLGPMSSWSWELRHNVNHLLCGEHIFGVISSPLISHFEAQGVFRQYLVLLASYQRATKQARTPPEIPRQLSLDTIYNLAMRCRGGPWCMIVGLQSGSS